MTSSTVPRTIEWVGGLDGHVALIDQTLLPAELSILHINDVAVLWEAIRTLRIRGAPAIGIAAAMGVVLGVRNHSGTDRSSFDAQLRDTCDYLAGSRPTAVNLTWALRRMSELAESLADRPVDEVKAALLDEARAIRDEDAAMCRAIGEMGQQLIPDGGAVLTHCNAGGLATAEYGTALAPMYAAHQRGRPFRVYADETRPLLQGARLTAWELQRAGVDVTVICDNMAGALMQADKIDLVITGADRIAANGDVANKIGTYSVAVLAHAHGIPFYVAAPSSTFDLTLSSGGEIPIETRDPNEIRRGFGKLTAPADVPCETRAFDVTPARLVRAIITERALIEPVDSQTIAAALAPTA